MTPKAGHTVLQDPHLTSLNDRAALVIEYCWHMRREIIAVTNSVRYTAMGEQMWFCTIFWRELK